MQKMKSVRVPQLAWYGDTELELQFPASWNVTTCHMAGEHAPKLNDEKIREAFANPIGTKPLRELAQGKKEAVIIFDDITRPTKVSELIPYVLQELASAGISDDSIRFISALGAHGAMNRIDMAKDHDHER